MSTYIYNDKIYPYFYPEPDVLSPGDWIVAFALTCYPYARSSNFDERAFPRSLRALGNQGNTKFYFLARYAMDGEAIEGLSYEDAVFEADLLNDAYDEELDLCEESWDWDKLPFDIRPGDMMSCR